jgi:hypothetical protein
MLKQGEPSKNAHMDAEMIHAIMAGNGTQTRLQQARDSNLPTGNVVVYNGSAANTGEPGADDNESRFFEGNRGLDTNKSFGNHDNRVTVSELDASHEQSRNDPGFRAFVSRYEEVMRTTPEPADQVAAIDEMAGWSNEMDIQTQPGENSAESVPQGRPDAPKE